MRLRLQSSGSFIGDREVNPGVMYLAPDDQTFGVFDGLAIAKNARKAAVAALGAVMEPWEHTSQLIRNLRCDVKLSGGYTTASVVWHSQGALTAYNVGNSPILLKRGGQIRALYSKNYPSSKGILCLPVSPALIQIVDLQPDDVILLCTSSLEYNDFKELHGKESIYDWVKSQSMKPGARSCTFVELKVSKV